jgi:membrane-associated protease RseP (regulator of RpoE activity)
METRVPSESSIMERLRQQLSGLMEVERAEVRREPNKVISFEGRLLTEPEAAFDRAAERFATLSYTAMLSEVDGDVYQILAVQGVIRPRPARPLINAVLFLVTVLTTMLAGLSPDIDFASPRWYVSGLPFAGALLAILLAHELAHYFVARRHGSPVSLPFFVPMPVSILGTMGAVILQRAPWRDRKALFDIGIAGPLAGLLVALPLLIVGLLFTRVGRPSTFMDQQAVQTRLEAQCENAEGMVAFLCDAFGGEEMQNIQEGNSLVYIAAKYLVFGQYLPDRSSGEDVWLSLPESPGGPIAFAAWAGLFVTALNLLPIGQLDGGHVAYALFGRRAWTLAYLMIGLMAALGVLLLLMGNPAWTTWLIWAVLGLFLGPRHPPPLNDASPLDRRRVLLGILVFVVFVLTFVPVPIVLAPAR